LLAYAAPLLSTRGIHPDFFGLPSGLRANTGGLGSAPHSVPGGPPAADQHPPVERIHQPRGLLHHVRRAAHLVSTVCGTHHFSPSCARRPILGLPEVPTLKEFLVAAARLKRPPGTSLHAPCNPLPPDSSLCQRLTVG
jgi:hypothetical protein